MASDKQRPEKRIKKLSRQADRIEQFLAENKPKISSTGKEIQSNVTDNESAKMATSHGAQQGYIANAMVDDKHQIITSADTGYYSIENLEAREDEKVDAYAPDQQFRKRDVRYKDAGRHRRSTDKRHEKYKMYQRYYRMRILSLFAEMGQKQSSLKTSFSTGSLCVKCDWSVP